MITAFKFEKNGCLTREICDHFCFGFRDRLGIVFTDLAVENSANMNFIFSPPAQDRAHRGSDMP